MDWKQLGKKIVKIGAPLVGTVVGGPVGGTIGAGVAALFGADPDDPQAIYEAIKADPQAALKLKEFELNTKVKLQELVVEQARIESEERLTTIREVNATMRSEASSEHWPQFSWRPFIGFCFPLTVMAVYVALPLADCVVPSVPDWIWLSFGSILGVATWDRGKQKRAQAGEESKPGMVSNVISAIRGSDK